MFSFMPLAKSYMIFPCTFRCTGCYATWVHCGIGYTAGCGVEIVRVTCRTPCQLCFIELCCECLRTPVLLHAAWPCFDILHPLDLNFFRIFFLTGPKSRNLQLHHSTSTCEYAAISGSLLYTSRRRWLISSSCKATMKRSTAFSWTWLTSDVLRCPILEGQRQKIPQIHIFFFWFTNVTSHNSQLFQGNKRGRGIGLDLFRCRHFLCHWQVCICFSSTVAQPSACGFPIIPFSIRSTFSQSQFHATSWSESHSCRKFGTEKCVVKLADEKQRIMFKNMHN